MNQRTAASRFMALDNKRQSMLTRTEHYSGLTLPYVFPPEQYQEGDWELRLDHHSVGAQAVNHLANKVVIGLFQPGFPFFKLEISDKLLAEFQAQGIETKDVEHGLAQGEKSAIKYMAEGNMRPKLFEAVKQLIITGNCLPVFHRKDDFELIGLRDYVIRRSRSGTVLEIVTKAEVTIGELESGVRDLIPNADAQEKADQKVKHYHWIVRQPGGEYKVTQWVEEHRLPEKYDSKYKSYETLPWQPQAWVLPSRHHYGIGLVEEYAGELTSITEFAESLSDGAALASVWRFLVDPSSTVRPEDIADGDNGDALPGTPNSMGIMQANVGNNMSLVSSVMQDSIQRFSRGFLLMSSVTRDAERVTAAEIRTLANELETGLGGVYSRLAASFQLPLANYLLRGADIKIEGTQITPMIVTGFDALSRAAELERIQLFLQDVANVTSLPPEISDWLKMGPILRSLAANRHMNADDYINNEQEVAQSRQQRQQALQAQQMQAQQDQIQGEPEQ